MLSAHYFILFLDPQKRVFPKNVDEKIIEEVCFAKQVVKSS